MNTRIAHSGSFELYEPPEKALYLFTAPGEKTWVPGWDPMVLNGDGFERGTVFTTGTGDEATIWVITDFDTEKYLARYARITPSSRAGTVEVSLSANNAGGSTVRVSYDLTALNESGNEKLADFHEHSYSEMLREWKSLLSQAAIDFQALIPRQTHPAKASFAQSGGCPGKTDR